MGVCLSSSETESKFMGSTQYSVMAERSSRRRGVKRTTRHKLRVCELMDATEGNNLKFSKSSLTPVKERIQIKKVKVLPPSVMMPFRSWMANAKRRVRDQIVADTTASCSDMSSDTVAKSMDTHDSIGAGTERPMVRTASGRGFVVSVSTPQGTPSCRTPPTSCSASVYTTIRSRERSMLPPAVAPGIEV